MTIFDIFRDIFTGRTRQGEQGEQGEQEYIGRHRYVYEHGAFMSERVPVVPGRGDTATSATSGPPEVADEAVTEARPEADEAVTEVIELPARWQAPLRPDSRRILGETLILDVRPTTHSYPHAHVRTPAHDITGEFFLTGASA